MSAKENDRIFYYDNLKFILIMLVVVGHFIQFFLSYESLKGLFLFIYSFHMPLFIFVTGFFAKKIITADTNKKLNKILSYLTLYFIYKITLFILLKYVLHQDYTFGLFTEMEPPWYLLACAIWIGVSSLFKNVKPLYMFIISIILCLLIGYDSSIVDQFCLSRVIVFYPFFLLGYYATKEQTNNIINKLHDKKYIIGSLLFIISCLALMIYFINDLYFLRSLFTARNPFMYIHFPFDLPMTGAVFRLLWLIISVIISLAVMNLIPRRETFFTKFGSRTLQVYILHYYIVVMIGYSSIGLMLSNYFGNLWPPIIILISIMTTFILSARCFEKPFVKILGYNFKKIYSK